MSVMTALILASNFFKPLWIVAAVFSFLFYLSSSFKQQICYTLYLAVFSGISQIYIVSLLSCFLLTTIRYVIDVIKKRKPFFKFQFFFTLCFVAVFSLIFGKVDTNGFFNWALFTSLMFFIYFIYIYHDEIDVGKCFDYLFWALVSSLILGLLCLPLDVLDQQIFPFDGTYYRLRLFALNVNHLAIFCIFNMCYVIHKIINQTITENKSLNFLKDKFFWFDFAKLVFLGIVGFLTLSKAFLLLLVCVLCYFILALILKLKTKCWVIIVPVVVVVLGLCLVFNDTVEALISRFFVYDIWDTFFSKIFTGRTGIWMSYLECVTSSFNKMFFGVGLLTKDVVSSGPHNTFLYFLYRVGVVGILALVVLFSKYAIDSKQKIKLKFSNCLMLVIFLVLACEEMVFSDRFFLFLVMAVLLTLAPKKKTEEISETKQVESELQTVILAEEQSEAKDKEGSTKTKIKS